MEPAVLSALSAILGSAVGGSASIATARLTRPERLTSLYSILNRIRLRCSNDVLAAAERTATRIVERYLGPSLSPEEMRQTMLARTDDPLKDFSEACRHELRMLERPA